MLGFHKIKKYLSSLVASYYMGSGFYRFSSGNYEKAIRFLEKSWRLNPDKKLLYTHYSHLGRANLRLGKHDKAYEFLSGAYDSYKLESPSLNKGLPRQDFVDYLMAYSELMKIKGDEELAKKLSCEASDYWESIREWH